MKIAIMQPYFFPYLGYFGLIKNTDRWIVFDTPQFIYHGWIERNRILKPKEGWQYINVPLKKHQRTSPINNIQIRTEEEWREKILAKLTTYKNIAPFYDKTYDFISDVFKFDSESIVELNCHIINKVCTHIGVEWNYKIFSEMNIEIEKPSSPDEWALNICKSIGNVDEYWNPPGGRSFFNGKKYNANNIKLRFFEQRLKPYNQRRIPFESGLSIIDVLMFNPINEVNKMLNSYDLV